MTVGTLPAVFYIPRLLISFSAYQHEFECGSIYFLVSQIDLNWTTVKGTILQNTSACKTLYMAGKIQKLHQTKDNEKEPIIKNNKLFNAVVRFRKDHYCKTIEIIHELQHFQPTKTK